MFMGLLPDKKTDYYRRVLTILKTLKNRDDPTTSYMGRLLDAYTLYYFVEHPNLFTTMLAYNVFREKVEPEYRALGGVGSEFDTTHLVELELLVMGHSVPMIHRQLYSFNIQTLNSDMRMMQYDKNIPDTNSNIAHMENIKNSTAPDMTRQQEKILAREVEKLEKLQDGVIHGHDDYRKLLDKQRRIVEGQQRRLEQNLDNKLRLEQMMLREENKPRFKMWHYTPNPRTRHSNMEREVVPLTEKFYVVNERTGDVDLLDYPGDWHGSPSNTYNCLCSISFCNEEDGSKRVR